MTDCRYLLALVFIAGASPAAAEEELVAAGKLVFAKCQTCHLIGPPTKTRRSTPDLNDLFGRRPGSLPNIKYSEALVAFGRDKLWDEANLTIFLRDPQTVVKGTKMGFLGLGNDQDIRAVLAYLATFDEDGMKVK